MKVQIVTKGLNEHINRKDMQRTLVHSVYETTIETVEENHIGEGTMPDIEPGSDEIPF